MSTDVLKLTASALVDADHLADVAEKLLAALNAVAGAEERMDARGHEADRAALEQAEETRSEYWRAVRGAVYEYRKRAERARAAMVPNVQSHRDGGGTDAGGSGGQQGSASAGPEKGD